MLMRRIRPNRVCAGQQDGPGTQQSVETDKRIRSHMTAKKKTTKLDFRIGENVVYPSHGVGRIVSVDEEG